MYGSPIATIIKSNDKIKVAVEYRKLNKKSIPRTHPTPHPGDLFDKRS